MNSITAIFKGGHGDGLRISVEADAPPLTLDAHCPDCGTRTVYELIKMKRTRNGTRGWYRPQPAP